MDRKIDRSGHQFSIEFKGADEINAAEVLLGLFERWRYQNSYPGDNLSATQQMIRDRRNALNQRVARTHNSRSRYNRYPPIELIHGPLMEAFDAALEAYSYPNSGMHEVIDPYSQDLVDEFFPRIYVPIAQTD